MNIKRFFSALLVLFIFIFVFESFVHGHLLLGLYSETPNAWRPFFEIKSLVPYNMGIMVALAF